MVDLYICSMLYSCMYQMLYSCISICRLDDGFMHISNVIFMYISNDLFMHVYTYIYIYIYVY